MDGYDERGFVWTMQWEKRSMPNMRERVYKFNARFYVPNLPTPSIACRKWQDPRQKARARDYPIGLFLCANSTYFSLAISLFSFVARVWRLLLLRFVPYSVYLWVRLYANKVRGGQGSHDVQRGHQSAVRPFSRSASFTSTSESSTASNFVWIDNGTWVFRNDPLRAERLAWSFVYLYPTHACPERLGEGGYSPFEAEGLLYETEQAYPNKLVFQITHLKESTVQSRNTYIYIYIYVSL